MGDRDVIWPAKPHALYTEHRYSPAIRSNGHLFVSGQVGVREDGTPEDGIEAQVRQAFANLDAILTAAGITLADVIDVTVFMVDPDANFARAWPIVGEYWGEAPFPTLTGVGVTWLAGFLFEIKVIAKLPEISNG